MPPSHPLYIQVNLYKESKTVSEVYSIRVRTQKSANYSPRNTNSVESFMPFLNKPETNIGKVNMLSKTPQSHSRLLVYGNSLRKCFIQGFLKKSCQNYM